MLGQGVGRILLKLFLQNSKFRNFQFFSARGGVGVPVDSCPTEAVAGWMG